MKQPVAARLPRTDPIKDDLLTETLRNVKKFYTKLIADSDSVSVARGPLLLKKLNSQWDRKKANAKKSFRKMNFGYLDAARRRTR